MASVPHISLVIPAYNEEEFLPPLLDSVDRARERYSRGADAVEVIVADNGSTDRTADIARERGCRLVQVEKRRIAASRNGGAAAAAADILCFVDADSRIHPDTFDAVEQTLTAEVVVGATGIKMSRMSLGIGASLAVIYPVIYALGADSGVVFCRKVDFEVIGGYDEEMPIAEDVEFFLRIKGYGRKTGRGFRRTRGARTVTSARKFDEHGDWHYLVNIAKAPLLMLRDPDEFRAFIQEYWYDVRG